MKGDFTRLNFNPQNHYRSVFMQQGRLILDADWNEQRLIEAHLHQSQNRDTIGLQGAPKSKAFNHFAIVEAPDGSADFLIAPGHFYVDGILCELEGTAVSFKVKPADSSDADDIRKLEVYTPFVDRKLWVSGQWLQILSLDDRKENDKSSDEPREETDTSLTDEPLFAKIQTISSPDSQSSPVELKVKLFPAPSQRLPVLTSLADQASGQFRRLATYTNQPHYSDTLDIEKNKSYLAYLDVWSRHITSTEDPNIAEKALSVPDTTTRSQTLWQIKLKKVATTEIDKLEDDWVESLLEHKHQVSLTASVEGVDLQQTDASQENQLYRVEVHKGGALNNVQLKWSRNNGTLVSPIDEITQNGIAVSRLGRDGFLSFHANQWVEIIDERRELQGESGSLARLTRVNDNRTLEFDPAYVYGDAITPTNFPDRPKVRGWDHNQNTAEAVIESEIITNIKSANSNPSLFEASAKITLERGITIQLQAEGGSKFNPGDYWLIPFRGDFEPAERLEWPRAGDHPTDRPVPQPPHGISHHYARIATIVAPQGDPASSSENTVQDLREQFPSLTHCLEKTDLPTSEELEVTGALYVTGKDEGDPFGYVPANVGIGTQSPTARLQIEGAKFQATGQVANGGNQINNIRRASRENQPLATLVGSYVEIGGTDFRVVDANSETITLSDPINIEDGQEVSFQYEHALIRVNDSSGADKPTQLLVTPTGQVGLGLSNPLPKDYRLSVRGAVAIGLDNLFDSSPLPPDPEAGLWVQNHVNAGGINLANSLAAINPSDEVSFTIEPNASDHTQLQFRAKGNSDDRLPSYVFKQGDVTIESSLIVGDGLRTQGRIEADAVQASTIQASTIAIQDRFALGDGRFNGAAEGGIGIGIENPPNSYDLSVNRSVAIGVEAFIRNTQTDEAVNLLVQNLVEASGLKIATRSDDGNGTFFKVEAVESVGGASPEENRPQLHFTANTSNDNQAAHFLFSQGAVTIDQSLSVSDRITIGNSNLTPQQTAPQHGLWAQGKVIAGALELATTNENAELTSFATIQPSNDPKKVSFQTQNEAHFEFLNSKVAITVEEGNGAALEVQGTTKLGSTTIKDALSIGEIEIKEVNIPNTDQKGLQINQPVGIQTEPESSFTLNVAGNVKVNKLSEQSSIALKRDISQLSIQEAIDYLRALDPIKFKFKSDDKNTLNLGFIAEKVPDILASLDKTSISPTDIIAILTTVVKFQESQLSSCFDIMRSHEGAIQVLSEKIATLEES